MKFIIVSILPPKLLQSSFNNKLLCIYNAYVFNCSEQTKKKELIF